MAHEVAHRDRLSDRAVTIRAHRRAARPPLARHRRSRALVLGLTAGQENALRSAEDYLDYSAFSRSGLIEQLMYEGYTREQAEYGVNEAGL